MSQPMMLQRCVALKIVVTNITLRACLQGRRVTLVLGLPYTRTVLSFYATCLRGRQGCTGSRVTLPECQGGGGYPTCCCSLRNSEIANKNYNLRTYFDMNFDNSKRKVLKLQFRSFFVVVENSRAVKLLVKNDWLNLSIY